MIKVINEVEVYDSFVNGNKKKVDLKIKSHWNESSKLTISLVYENGQEKYQVDLDVLGSDLIKATQNAQNSKRY